MENRKQSETRPAARPGQDIVITGHIGIGGAVQAVRERREILRQTLPEALLETAEGFGRDLERRTLPLEQTDGMTVREVKEGGIFTALWDLAREDGVGLTVYLKKIPVRQETIEICEVLDLNPYELLSGGCFLVTADNGNDVIFALEQQGIRGTFAGKVTDSHDKVIRNGDSCRYLNRPGRDEIWKLEKGDA